MQNEWSRRCGRRRAPRVRGAIAASASAYLDEDAADLFLDVLLEVLHLLGTINQHIGVIIMDSIQRDHQTPAEKRERHLSNVRTIQDNIGNQIRDLNADLEKIQNEHPTIAMGDVFMSVHQLDSNFRAALDVAKEAAEIDDVDDIRQAGALINTESSSTLPAPPAPAAPASQVNIDGTAQPRPEANDSPNREHDTPGV
jgi:hypothetical protein